MAGPLEASLAVLNGVLGDYLARTDNGLATEMELFLSSSGAGPLALERGAVERALRGIAATSPGAEHATSAWSSGSPVRVVVLVHGLMWTETVWRMGDGSDYGTRLAADLGFVPLYVRYNTGLPLAENGALLDRLLTRLLAAAPGAIDEMVAIGHSMGGLAIRSACHAARSDAAAASRWLPRLRRAFYLGTPHLGAPLERIGRLATRILRTVPDPYARMVAEIADLRSDGIKDLGDGLGGRGAPLRDAHHPVPLLPEIEHYLVAASLSGDPLLATLFGDALVPVTSATNGAVHPIDAPVPPSHMKLFPSSGHMGLAHDEGVYRCIRAWCGGLP